MSTSQPRDNAAPMICPHCGQKIVASAPNLSAAAQAIREETSMMCPGCGQEFYLSHGPAHTVRRSVVEPDATTENNAERND